MTPNPFLILAALGALGLFAGNVVSRSRRIPDLDRAATAAPLYGAGLGVAALGLALGVLIRF